MKTQRPNLIPFLAMEATVSITVTKLRTFLAIVGIIIGVGSVILMVAVGVGSQKAVEGSLAKLGANIITLNGRVPPNQAMRTLKRDKPTRLLLKDVQVIRALPSVSNAVGLNTMQAKITNAAQKFDSRVFGSFPEYLEIRGWKLEQGTMFTDEDVKINKRVAVIGQTVANKAFGEEPPLGKTLRINSLPYEVIGVVESKGQAPDGSDMDDMLIVPFTAAQRFASFLERGDITPTILIQAVSREATKDAVDEITDYMRQRLRLSATEPDMFTVRNLSALVQAASDTSRALSMLLGAVASISLVVGGIGIMNIMLVTVTERRREIGIRRSIGATQSDIMNQFVMEAIMIATLGGLGGLLLGVGGAMLAREYMEIPAEITAWSTLLALGVSAVVGIASGVYPASRAARIHPVEALRSVN